MKFLFVVSPGSGKKSGIGGAQIHVRDLARALSANGHEVTIATKDNTSVSEMYQREPVTWINLPDFVRPLHPLQDIKTSLHLRKIIKSTQPDIISLHSSKPGIVGRFAAIGLPAKVLFTAHGWAFTPGVPALRRYLYLSIEFLAQFFCDRIVTVSEFDRALALSFGFSSRKVLTIHNGMPDRLGNLKHRNNMSSDSPVGSTGVATILTIARFSSQKDYETLFSALKLMQTRSVRLIAIGGGDDFDKLKKLIQDLGIENKVELVGEKKDVYPYFEQATAYVLSSHWEGLPRSIIEAMMMKLPVVATNVGGNSELIDDGVTGFLVNRSNPVELAEKLDRLIVDSALTNEMGKKARQRYEDMFSFENMMARYTDLYDNLV